MAKIGKPSSDADARSDSNAEGRGTTKEVGAPRLTR
jgi:hypothetical protein